MFPISSVLYVSCTLITFFDFMPGVLGSNKCISLKNITATMNSETLNINKTYHIVPAGVGGVNVTERGFTDKMKTLFSGKDNELLCAVTEVGELKTIPNITCEGAFGDELKNNLRKININYSDEAAQDEVLDLVWKSEVGKKMLTLLSNEIFGNETSAKARVKQMWFIYEGSTLLRLFPDVFLGYETQDEFYGTPSNISKIGEGENHGIENVTLCEGEEEEEDEEDGSDEEFDDFPYDAAPVSWTGNLFRQIEGDLNITKGNIRPLVENSSYLADIEVQLRNESRNSTFVVGTTFIYDFISFSMCWIYGVRLEKCIVPLPGNTTTMIEITNITSESSRPGIDNSTEDVYLTCIGFKVNKHQTQQ